MQIGMIGLGRMGANMARRLLRHGHDCAVWDRDPAAVERLAGEGARGARSIEDLVRLLAPPRAVWIMVPAGAPTETTVEALRDRLDAGDVILDGGNSHYQDDVRRARELATRGIHYLDVGTSGGVWGLERGYCLMIGGDPETARRLEPIFRALAPGPGTIAESPGREARASTAAAGFLHCGPAGAGHFVKMVHNGIEYGLMQAYAEGFDLLRGAADRGAAGEASPIYELDLADIAEVWRRGSVVTSWLLDLAAAALAKSPRLEEFDGVVGDSGEGRWTIEAAIDRAVPADVLAAALFARFRSRRDHTFAERMLSALRRGFGGHVEAKS